MKKITGVVLLCLLFAGLNIQKAWADASSSNYAMTDERFTGGGGSASSANYQVVETSLDIFSGGGLSSTNYALDTKIGVSGGSGIATINSVTPADKAKFYHDDSASYVVSAVSQDGDTLTYRAKQDATVKAGPQSSNTVSWSLSASDIGRHSISLEAIDPQGTTLKKQDAYVVRRPSK